MKCYDEYASGYDAWFMKNANLLASEVKLVARTLADGGEILSIGCGSGLMESMLKRDFGIVVADGVEPSPGMAEIARKRGLNVLPAAAADFPVMRQYDTVLMNGCPSYIDDLDAAFAHAAEALKPGGRLVVADVPKESAYAGPEFASEADRVEAVMDRLAREHPEFQPEMDKAVAAGTRQELEYWKA